MDLFPAQDPWDSSVESLYMLGKEWLELHFGLSLVPWYIILVPRGIAEADFTQEKVKGEVG